MAESSNATTTQQPGGTLEEVIENAKRAFALKRYEQAVEFYASALEIATNNEGDIDVENADLYFAYGQALLENAISQSSVLAKEQGSEEKEQDEQPQASTSSNKGPILSFSGDAEDAAPDEPVDLFGNAEKAVAEADAAEAQEEAEEREQGDDEPEDDFNEAWDIFEIARNLYEKRVETHKDTPSKLKLADTFIALGDVSLETEKFDQAILDYQQGLRLKNEILPLSSRQIAEVHYKLCIVLDLTSGRLAEAITHSESALESVDQRLKELQARLAMPDSGESSGSGDSVDGVSKLSKSQVEAELKELNELRNDLALKVEELKTSPNDAPQGASAPEMVAAALDKELNTATNGTTTEAKVNDLTSIVKKRKKPAEEATADAGPSTGKRKAEENPSEDISSEKKMRLSPA